MTYTYGLNWLMLLTSRVLTPIKLWLGITSVHFTYTYGVERPISLNKNLLAPFKPLALASLKINPRTLYGICLLKA
jgi:hypothetical protein